MLVYQELMELVESGIISGPGLIVGPASIDLTVSDEFLVPVVDDSVARPALGQGPRLRKEFMAVMLGPGQCCLASTQQAVRFPDDLCAQLFTRSTAGRCFMNHQMAGWIDPGFHGVITLEFKNDLPIPSKIVAGDRLIQMVVHRVTPSLRPYAGKYNHDMGVSPAKEPLT